MENDVNKVIKLTTADEPEIHRAFGTKYERQSIECPSHVITGNDRLTVHEQSLGEALSARPKRSVRVAKCHQ